MIRHIASIDHFTYNVRIFDRPDRKLDQSVIDQYIFAHLDITFQIFVRYCCPVCSAHDLLSRKPEGRACLKINLSALKISQSDLGPLRVLHRRKRKP